MKKEETAPFEILKIALDINDSNLSKIYWQETFIEYIKENNIDLYDKAVKYTNDLESDGYFTEEEKIKQKTEPIIESITHHRLQ